MMGEEESMFWRAAKTNRPAAYAPRRSTIAGDWLFDSVKNARSDCRQRRFQVVAQVFDVFHADG